MKRFDEKVFNGEVFASYSRTIADPVKTRLIESGVFYGDPSLASRLPEQVGGNYITRPITGLLAGEPVVYDGGTDIDDGELKTYSQGIGAIGFAKSFTEKDFTPSISGKDFMFEVASQVARYWRKHEQKVLLAVLKGIFGSALSANAIALSGASATDVNDVCREVAGDNADMFEVVFMHSGLAKEYEKIQVLKYALENSEEGMIKPSQIGYLNGRLVIIDDSCPVADGANGAKVYTSYILGRNAFCYQPLPVEVPAEMARDAKKNGGETSLITRERYILAPEGVSLKQSAYASKTSLSVSDLETANNWELVNDGANPISLKVVPFCAMVTTIGGAE